MKRAALFYAVLLSLVACGALVAPVYVPEPAPTAHYDSKLSTRLLRQDKWVGLRHDQIRWVVGRVPGISDQNLMIKAGPSSIVSGTVAKCTRCGASVK